MVQGFFSKSSQAARKQATKEFVKLWCAATQNGERDVFEAQWDFPSESDEHSSKKRRRSFGDATPAVAGSMLRDPPSEVAGDEQTETIFPGVN